MAMAKSIIEKKLFDQSFLENYCNGFDAYQQYLQEMDMDLLIKPTGLTKDEVDTLVNLYANNKPASIILGYGLQRYRNGGKNIRYIDALGAITGNIGVPGGGINYANRCISKYIDSDYMENLDVKATTISFKRPLFSDYLLEEGRGQIKGIVVTKSNLVLQMPDTQKAKAAFSSIPFKVVIDHFMTDTAALADYILPCTGIYEEEDFIFTSMWHNYFTYTEKFLVPPKGVKHEFEIFQLLAKHMEMKDFLEKYRDPRSYLERALRPLLEKIQCNLEDIKGKRMKLEGNDVPWQDKKFATASGKFEIVNPSIEVIQLDEKKEAYPLQLLTLHPKSSLHSQHFVAIEEGELPEIFCNGKTMGDWNLREDQKVSLVSPSGKIDVKVKLDEGVGEGLLVAYEGWWLKNQGLNNLTPQGISDLGNQAIYNNCYCRIEIPS